MKLVFFTKLFKSYSTDELITFAKEKGLDGFDLAIRPDYPINEDNIATELVPFSKKCADAGLSIELATIGMRPMPLDDPATDAAYAACAEACVPCIKLGYDVWDPEKPWREQFDAARKNLEGFEKLALKHGVKVVLHTHSGPYIGLNASSVAHLVDGLDPKAVGAYLDIAHLAIDGEPEGLATAISGEYLSMIAAKNARYVGNDGSEPWDRMAGSNYKIDWCKLADGLVPWKNFVAHLKDIGYDGAISVHGEYSDRHAVESVLEYFLPDVEFMKEAIGG